MIRNEPSDIHTNEIRIQDVQISYIENLTISCIRYETLTTPRHRGALLTKQLWRTLFHEHCECNPSNVPNPYFRSEIFLTNVERSRYQKRDVGPCHVNNKRT
jgi:hypothetical protein